MTPDPAQVDVAELRAQLDLIRERWSNGPTNLYPSGTEDADQRDVDFLVAGMARLLDALDDAGQRIIHSEFALAETLGWFPFGTHIDQPVPLEFAGEDDGGMPRWERPALLDEVEELRAMKARVEALADNHDRRSASLWQSVAARRGLSDERELTVAATMYGNFARRIRAALEQTP